MKTEQIKIYHNPNCGTSRNVLALIRHTGVEPEIIHYLENPPTKEALEALIKDAGLNPREALRTNVDEYALCHLDNEALTDNEIIDCMLKHPILINRPFVVTEKGTRLCRPSEKALEILTCDNLDEFYKEDGEKII